MVKGEGSTALLSRQAVENIGLVEYNNNNNNNNNNCCAASVASEQQHKQDLRKIYRRRGDEFSN